MNPNLDAAAQADDVNRTSDALILTRQRRDAGDDGRANRRNPTLNLMRSVVMSADRGPRPQPPTMLTCPTCGTRFHLTKTPTPPFCCQRCQLIDLGRWFNEDIGLPYEGNPGDTPVENRDDDDSDYE